MIADHLTIVAPDLAAAASHVRDLLGIDMPAGAMADFGLTLVDFAIEHPDPAGVEAAYRRPGLRNPPRVLKGSRCRYRAAIGTPTGVRMLY